jgi:hypothetical protein
MNTTQSSLKQVIKDNSDFKTLINAVIDRIGLDSVEDVVNHGINGGFGGFIYYSDTVAFFKKYKKDILRMAENMASDLGEDMITMIQNFNCLSSGQYPKRKPDYTATEIGEAIWSGRGESATQIQNAMAWFAAEEVCRMFDR